eukprot:5270731-Prorocentrum_lima.AAC.1
MTSSLVGSEMCIRDRPMDRSSGQAHGAGVRRKARGKPRPCEGMGRIGRCLLYTSDAADDM